MSEEQTTPTQSAAAAVDTASLTEEQSAAITEAIDSRVEATSEGLKELVDRREALFTEIGDQYPELAQARSLREAVRSGSLGFSDAADLAVPGRDKAPAGTQRTIGGWLTADATTAPKVTGPSTWFTVSHWHWLAAKGFVRQIPSQLGPVFPHLFVSEAQVIYDLKHWGVFGTVDSDEDGDGSTDDEADNTITDEAADMFAAVTGDAEITLYGIVLLHGQRRAPVAIPRELDQFGMREAVRDVPRVNFAIGVGKREVVTATVNNNIVVFTRRLRRTTATADAAEALRTLLDPNGDWPPFPLPSPITVTADVAGQLAHDPDTAGIIDAEPGEDADTETRVADEKRRAAARQAAKRIVKSANLPTRAADALSEIATATTRAMAVITVRTCDVDVSRGPKSSLSMAFLTDRGVVASYPTGEGQWRRITYVSGTTEGVEKGIVALRDAYRGCG
ncbi:hypothetical protein H7J07_04720 [Mycobacterium koreense]|uniref:Uncharacterized protein n=1 Tax=Mycolicibacillus koreensis TaxID=1069220 RepID=A0A7I7SCC1_9MYCO|nr:hypothetical protein [Mycolicibacillus koreensis]MCV7247560.1 hypothetical protein [Mycolicibacillus koreensis]OSC32858.1 hypothetical protein B8W67_14160 [Mycolicibacillus koreensis]BBY53939.1 hypothetical protein MKOR_11900 [Mycolicibacillus koreensis]